MSEERSESLKKKSAQPIIINAETNLGKIAKRIASKKSVTIDCGVTTLIGIKLNEIMRSKELSHIKVFNLINVCGQTLIGTGISGDITINVHGLMGNHSAAFTDSTTINSFPTTFNNGVKCPGDAQVAIGNTSNPKEINIAGSVDDLFASYSPSGIFRVASQCGNRSGLRAGAGVPAVWRGIDFDKYKNMTDKERIEDMLYKYQKRRSTLVRLGWRNFLNEYKTIVENRKPPKLIFGRRARDYLMEYAQGTIGVVLNLYNVEDPVGYYTCSGMTAGRAYVRGNVTKERLGERVTFAPLEQSDLEFLETEIIDFHKTFNNKMNQQFQASIDDFVERLYADKTSLISEFKKIVPVTGASN